MRLDELTPWLYARTTGGIRWGLDRTQELLAGVGDPHRRFASILIAGTNGKGSVAALCDSVLREQGGRRVGLYTSPHLISITERVRVDGEPIAAEAMAAAAERLREGIERTGASFFEATTAIAFLLFADAGVETAVVEVGLGGRLDATNVLDPLTTAVTSIDLDHMEYLGEDIESIAREKAGIFRSGVPAICAAENDVARASLRAEAERVGARYVEVTGDSARLVSTSLEGSTIELDTSRWGRVELGLPLAGAHQARNAAVAVKVLASLPGSMRPELPALRRGFASVQWPGRLQVERIGGATWVFDVAHNPAGTRALAETLKVLNLPRPVVLLAGILSDKDWRGMLAALAPAVDTVVVTIPHSAPEKRRWSLGEVEGWLASELRVEACVVPDLGDALARCDALAPHGTIVVAGSVHTVGDALAALEIPV